MKTAGLPVARLTERRLRKAAELARDERRISDIAFECGFNDLSISTAASAAASA
ncbi:MAG TPA: hypothetical protein VGL45_08600 [Bradyrhizobium sp.]|jgi:AraC-like DNA-binding protein